MEPLVLRCRILAPYVPLRATSSKSVPGVDIVYIVQRSVTKTEFRNCLLVSILSDNTGKINEAENASFILEPT